MPRAGSHPPVKHHGRETGLSIGYLDMVATHTHSHLVYTYTKNLLFIKNSNLAGDVYFYPLALITLLLDQAKKAGWGKEATLKIFGTSLGQLAEVISQNQSSLEKSSFICKYSLTYD